MPPHPHGMPVLLPAWLRLPCSVPRALLLVTPGSEHYAVVRSATAAVACIVAGIAITTSASTWPGARAVGLAFLLVGGAAAVFAIAGSFTETALRPHVADVAMLVLVVPFAMAGRRGVRRARRVARSTRGACGCVAAHPVALGDRIRGPAPGRCHGRGRDLRRHVRDPRRSDHRHLRRARALGAHPGPPPRVPRLRAPRAGDRAIRRRVGGTPRATARRPGAALPPP